MSSFEIFCFVFSFLMEILNSYWNDQESLANITIHGKNRTEGTEPDARFSFKDKDLVCDIGIATSSRPFLNTYCDISFQLPAQA